MASGNRENNPVVVGKLVEWDIVSTDLRTTDELGFIKMNNNYEIILRNIRMRMNRCHSLSYFCHDQNLEDRTTQELANEMYLQLSH